MFVRSQLALGYLVRQRRCSKSLTQDGHCFQLSLGTCFHFSMLLNLGPWNSERLAIPDGKILVLVQAINNR